MEIMMLGIVLVFAAFFAIGMLVAMAITFKLAILAVILVFSFRIARNVSHWTTDQVIPGLRNLISRVTRVVFTFGWVFLLVIALRVYRQSETTQVATVVPHPDTFLVASVAQASDGSAQNSYRLGEKISQIIEDRTEKVVSKLVAVQEKVQQVQERAAGREEGPLITKDLLKTNVAGDSSEDDKNVVVINSSPKPQPKQKTIRFESGPCSTPEKARTELESKIVEYISQEQRSSGHAISISPGKVLAGMKINPKIDVEYKEVGGDKYPVFRASLAISPDDNFVRRALVQANQAVARDRFELLIGFSGCLALFLGIWSRLI